MTRTIIQWMMILSCISLPCAFSINTYASQIKIYIQRQIPHLTWAKFQASPICSNRLISFCCIEYYAACSLLLLIEIPQFAIYQLCKFIEIMTRKCNVINIRIMFCPENRHTTFGSERTMCKTARSLILRSRIFCILSCSIVQNVWSVPRLIALLVVCF